MSIYFIVSGQISVYLVKIKEISITSEMISYHFTSDRYDLYFCCSLWMTSVFFIVSKADVTSSFRFLNTSNFFVSELNYQVLVCILECKAHFGIKIILICRNFLFLSLQRFTC